MRGSRNFRQGRGGFRSICHNLTTFLLVLFSSTPLILQNANGVFFKGNYNFPRFHITCVFPGRSGPLAFPGSDNFGSNPLCFTFRIKTLPDMSSADNLCKLFGPRSGPTLCSGLIGVQTVCKGYQQMTM